MPTYEYECTKCGDRFEFFQGMTEPPLRECKKCHSPLKRLIGNGAGIIFKGAGFYATDYKSKTGKNNTAACPNSNKDNPTCNSCSAKPDKK